VWALCVCGRVERESDECVYAGGDAVSERERDVCAERGVVCANRKKFMEGDRHPTSVVSLRPARHPRDERDMYLTHLLDERTEDLLHINLSLLRET